MSRRLLLLLILTAGCSWSNSLYQARLLSGQALDAEKHNRPGEARSDWGQVIDKADSALARMHHGSGRIEAAWLRGRARARTNDCGEATGDLETALAAAPGAKWRDPLLLELARCKETLHDVGAFAIYGQLVNSRDPAVRAAAREHSARVLVDQGRWSDALALLVDLPGTAPRVDAARAELGLGHVDSALALLSPLAHPPDPTVDWMPLVTTAAATDRAGADTLIGWLNAEPGIKPLHRDSLLLAALRGALAGDSGAVEARYRRIAAVRVGPVIAEAQGLYAEWLFQRVSDSATLQRAIDSTTDLAGGEFGASLAAYRAASLRRLALYLVALDSTTEPGSPRGDLTMFVAATFARDSLHAPSLAASYLRRVEAGWPESPYRAKAMFLRSTLVPDSSSAILARLAADTTNPYVRLAEGRGSPRLANLEDSLDTYVHWMAQQRKRTTSAEPPVDLRFR